jgi:hypothetical protein
MSHVVSGALGACRVHRVALITDQSTIYHSFGPWMVLVARDPTSASLVTATFASLRFLRSNEARYAKMTRLLVAKLSAEPWDLDEASHFI